MDRQGPDQEITIDVSTHPVMFSLHATDSRGHLVHLGPTSNYLEITEKLLDLAFEAKQNQER
jgi:hypothetical protein